jgi:hypothetical protein
LRDSIISPQSPRYQRHQKRKKERLTNHSGEPLYTQKPLILSHSSILLPASTQIPMALFLNSRLSRCIIILFCIPLLIAFADVLWAPTVLERYHMDIYWVLCLLCYLVTGLYYRNLSAKTARRFSSIVSIWAFLSLCKCILLFLVPYDYNFTFYYVEALEKIRKILMLGRGVGLY